MTMQTARAVGQSGQVLDKVARYSWRLKDEPGTLMNLDKRVIRVNEEYQRSAHEQKVLAIAASWSWMAFGCLIVAYRDETYWAIDGMHRWLAAMKRSDITKVPCIVFETEDIKSEARGFLDANSLRKPVTAHEKYKAMLVVGDENARLVNEVFESLGITMTATAKASMQLNAAHWCSRHAGLNPERFIRVMETAALLCKAEGLPVKQILLSGLWHLDAKVEGGLSNRRLLDLLIEKGGSSLMSAAQKSAAHYGNRGARVLAEGMLHEINRKLRIKIMLTQRPAGDGE